MNTLYDPAARGLRPVIWLAQGLLFALLVNLTLIYKFPLLSLANKVIGGAFVGTALVLLLLLRRPLPPEVTLFFLFLVWAVLTGVMVAQNYSFFTREATLVTQIGILMFGVAYLTAVEGTPRAVLFALLVAALFLLVTGVLSGQYDLATEEEARYQFRGTLKNPNAFGFFMLYGITAALYFWRRSRRRWVRLGLLALAFAMLMGIVLSASRKSFLAAFVLVGLWLWFDYRRELLRRARVAVALGLLVVGAAVLVDRVMAATYLGRRMERAQEQQFIDPTRRLLYERGADVIISSPLFGVGLGNYRVVSGTSAVAHSDYVEVASSAGLVGAALYLSIYLVLWRRLDRLKVLARRLGREYRDGLLRALILTILALGLGKPNFSSIMTMTLVAAVVGYSFGAERRLRRALQPAAEPSWGRGAPPAGWAGARAGALPPATPSFRPR